jgi:peroxiredoxin
MSFTRFTKMGWNVGLILGLLLAVLGCSGGPTDVPDRAASTGSGTLASGTGGPDEEKIAPAFELEDLDGRTVSLAESAGRVRLIDFWATWCPPCRDEIPMLNELHQAYGEQGLTILAISDEKSDVVREFAEEIGMEYTNLIDPGDVTAAYRVLGLPMAFLVDQDGRIVDRYMGPKSRKHLEKQIRELLELPPAT